MSKCSKCGRFTPFAGCPTCPPHIAMCQGCGEQVIVEYMTEAELDIIVQNHHERASRRDLTDLGDIKQR